MNNFLFVGGSELELVPLVNGQCRIDYEDPTGTVHQGGVIDTASWHHVALTTGGGNITFWLDGYAIVNVNSVGGYVPGGKEIQFGNFLNLG